VSAAEERTPSEREGSQRERGATRADRPAPAPDGLSEERTLLALTVNGARHESAADPDTPLLYVLRNELGLVGARFGCGMGLCGACFVHVDGAVVASCDTPLWSVEGKTVVTVEGLAPGDELHPVQQAMLDEQAAQCAYCVTGVIMSGAALLERSPQPDRAEVVAALDRNLCRCGAHNRMVRAVLRAGGGDG
jgi:nicotinate dehydrogenase subunit A